MPVSIPVRLHELKMRPAPKIRLISGKKRGGGLLALTIGYKSLIQNCLEGGHVTLKVRFCTTFRRHSMPIRGEARPQENAAASFLLILP